MDKPTENTEIECDKNMYKLIETSPIISTRYDKNMYKRSISKYKNTNKKITK